MKKVLFFAAIAALISVVVSCNNKPAAGGEEAKSVKQQDAISKDVAKNIVFSPKVENMPIVKVPITGAPEKETKAVKQIVFTEGGRFIMTVVDAPLPKADDGEEVIVGPFTYKDGVYTLEGVGSVKIDGKGITITPLTGDAVEAIAEVVEAIESGSDAEANAARVWKIKSVVIAIKGGDLDKAGIEKSFDNGLDLKAVADYAKSNGVQFTEEQLNKFMGYSVKEIIFSGSDTFAITFTDAKPFYGQFKIESTSFEWDLASVGNEFLNGKATGTISFPAQGRCQLIVKAKINAQGKDYDGTLNFVLEEVR
jgi:hypothetical protein